VRSKAGHFVRNVRGKIYWEMLKKAKSAAVEAALFTFLVKNLD